MEENLLSYLAGRWGSGRSAPTAEPSSVAEAGNAATTLVPRSVAVVATSRLSASTVGNQAELLRQQLTDRGWRVSGIEGEGRNSRSRGAYRRLRLSLSCTIDSIRESDITHILTSGEAWSGLRVVATLVVARFFGRKSILQIVGDGSSAFKGVSGLVVRPFLRLADRVWAAPVCAAQLSKRLQVVITPAMLIIDLKAVNRRVLNRLQPSVIVDARGTTPSLLSDLLKGFLLTKQKYPRSEMIIVTQAAETAILIGALGNRLPSGVELIIWSGYSEYLRLLDRSDVYINMAYVSDVPLTLLLASARGSVVIVRRGSLLASALINSYGYPPRGYRDGSELADRLISLVENPSMVTEESLRSKGLAEQFAWDNTESQWLSRYDSLARS